MNVSQSKILGYCLSVGGNQNAGATVNEIIKHTGLSQNTVYTNLRVGVPGLMECAGRSINGAKMYYCTPKSISEIGASEFAAINPNSLVSAANSNCLDVFDSDTALLKVVESNVNAKPANYERLSQIVHTINHPSGDLNDANLKTFYIVAGLTLAGIAQRLSESSD